jgi:outer membrane biosynthesis protein TonB
MTRRLDSIIVGGAMLFGSMAHRRASHVARQVDDLGEAMVAVEEILRESAARPPESPAAQPVERPAESPAVRPADRPPVPGMPLPTGYGLQVRGPDDESIILPVCLPPGFELASMVLCPEFLPRAEAPAPPARVAEPGPVARRQPAPAPAPVPAKAPAPAVAPMRERLSGTLQYVFGNDPGLSMDETFGGAVDAVDPKELRALRASGVETHHL